MVYMKNISALQGLPQHKDYVLLQTFCVHGTWNLFFETYAGNMVRVN